MRTFHINCGNCKSWLTVPLSDPSISTHCTRCGTEIQLEAFPALLKDVTAGRPAEKIIVEDDSSCFYHPTKKAVVACEGCGRFLCALCDIEFDGRHLCPGCIETGARKGKMETLQNEIIRYDNIALAVAIIPLILFYVTLISAPAALYLAVRYWNYPTGIIHKSKYRFVIAIIIAGAQLAAWTVAAVMLIDRLLS